MTIGAVGAGVVILGIATSLLFVRVVGGRIREQARDADANDDPDELPEH